MTSPNFNFSIAQNESILSAEAQRIMESVRGEAAKIKVQMQVERAKQDYMDGEVDRPYGVGGRAIAKPKGKAGRYSDAHMQEFKKMDSIAGHASVWKTKMQATPIQRSKSKGDLEADEPAKQLPRSKSFKLIRSNDTERLENTAPGKRAKKTHDDDTSTARPLSQGKLSENENFGLAHPKALPQSGLPLAVLTPTKSSLTRTASAKSMKTSMIPSLGRSNSTKTLGSPAVSRTEGSSKYIASLAKFSNMKSILHRHQPKLFNDPVKVDARPHQPVEGGAKLDKELPSLPGTPSLGLKRSPTLTKRVDFTPNSKPRPHLTPVSPSPSRIPASPTQRQVVYPSVSQPIVYPLLANSPNITTRSKTPRMSTPGDFTFRADKTIQFNPISPSKATSTIRQVRPSGITTPLSVFENPPPIPHGLINKKRRRVESDDEDVENSASQNPFSTNDDEPRAKKLKSLPPKEMQTEKALKSTANGSRVPKSGKKEKGKGVLTLSRLNMLARPKKR